ncbi:MafI family immunity protein [Rathayibacter toxicus]|uniref:MafI family immunity protein n=1 Tax=Rathayibacter toxicus TaxID=145458 RepID=UPI000CE7AB8C|nr:MafI family immunity protein [Rathayibacter toxicus]PPI54091.1 hypothetical protein C5D35_07080 [Rathayibacter toxicus]QOD11213.1 MafI family immunity protein [Rathayibacter toxicus]QWL27955.1 MafI family immunity protein [Rathayibacter toxicus]
MPISNGVVDPYDAELFQLISDIEGLLSPATLEEATEYVEHNEYEICLELIITILEEIDRPIPKNILNRIREHSAGLGLGEEACKDLRSE